MAKKEIRKSIYQFKSNQSKILNATESGLDIHVDLLINYDIPATPEGYIIRLAIIVGEGRSGTCSPLVNPRELKLLDQIKESIGNELSEFKSSNLLFLKL